MNSEPSSPAGGLRMSISRRKDEKLSRSSSLQRTYADIAQKLKEIGHKFGFKSQEKVKIEGGEFDFVWFFPFHIMFVSSVRKCL